MKTYLHKSWRKVWLWSRSWVRDIIFQFQHIEYDRGLARWIKVRFKTIKEGIYDKIYNWLVLSFLCQFFFLYLFCRCKPVAANPSLQTREVRNRGTYSASEDHIPSSPNFHSLHQKTVPTAFYPTSPRMLSSYAGRYHDGWGSSGSSKPDHRTWGNVPSSRNRARQHINSHAELRNTSRTAWSILVIEEW